MTSPTSRKSRLEAVPPSLHPRHGRDIRTVELGVALIAVLLTIQAARGVRLAADNATFPRYATKFFRLLDADPIGRDSLATTSSGNFRKLDRLVAPGAKMFASGLGGPENGRRLGNFFWAIYYFFPRRIDVSLNQVPQFQAGGWLAGAETPSKEELIQRGYDIQLGFEVGRPEDEQMMFTPLNVERAYRTSP